MKISYQNNKRAGYGQFILSQLSYAAAEIRFMLKRASDHKCLSPSGWQEAETALSPDASYWLEETLHIEVGPQVVDNLDMREAYRFTLLPGEGDSQSAVLKVDSIVYSPLSGGQGIAGGMPDRVPLHPGVAGPEPPVTPEAVVPKEAESGHTDARHSDVGMPAVEQAGAKRGLKIPLIALALAAAIIVAVIAGVYTSSQREAQQPPLQQAYQHLNQENPNAQSSLELGLELEKQNTGEARDAAFLLFEDAAEKGNIQAMMYMARYYDPLDNTPNGSIIKEAEQALKWYEAALQAGEKSAQARIEALKKWMEENANS